MSRIRKFHSAVEALESRLSLSGFGGVDLEHNLPAVSTEPEIVLVTSNSGGDDGQGDDPLPMDENGDIHPDPVPPEDDVPFPVPL